MLSLKQLNYALALQKAGSFKQAAVDSFVSQSTLSTAIGELEQHLGVVLFERDTRHVRITPVGELILAEALKIQASVLALKDLALLDQKPFTFNLKLGFIPTIGPYLLPKIWPLLKAKYPHFTPQIQEATSAELIEALHKGDLDVVVLALPYPMAGVKIFEFGSESFVWVVPKIKSECSAEQILLLRDGHCLKDHALSACQLSQSGVDHALSATSLATLVQMVAVGLGKTLVPAMALSALVDGQENLTTQALADAGPHRRLALVCREGFSAESSLLLLVDLFAEACAL
jgi:LysR family hydrogen peroxide-inducible transcriptional activator